MNVPDSIGSAEGLVGSFQADRLSVRVYQTWQQASAAASTAVASEIRRLIAGRGRAVCIFDSSDSQSELLGNLAKAEGVEWTRVIGFHTAEYLGLGEDARQSRRKFLLDRLVRRVPMAEFHGLRGEAANPDAVCSNYAALLRSRPPDFAVLEIGENGQLAFNDSRACDFSDSAMVKIVEEAISLTIPALMACQNLYVMATGEGKREAVSAVVEGEITEICPASILRTHPSANLFLDRQAARLEEWHGLQSVPSNRTG